MRHVRYFYTLSLTQQNQKPKQLLHKGIKPSKTLQLETCEKNDFREILQRALHTSFPNSSSVRHDSFIPAVDLLFVRAHVCICAVIMWLNDYKQGPGPVRVVTHSLLPFISSKLLGGWQGKEKTDEEEGSIRHIIGCAWLLRGGAHTGARKRNQEKCTQGANPLKEGLCVLNTAQYVEKEKGNQANSSSKLLKNRRR